MANRVKYTKEVLVEAAKTCKSVAEVCRQLGTSCEGSMNTHIKRQLQKFGVDTSHFLGKAAHAGEYQTGIAKKRTPQEILSSNKERREKGITLRYALLKLGRPYQCEECTNPGIWNHKDLMLEVDHINGDWKNCKEENLRFLCPPCHSQITYQNFVNPTFQALKLKPIIKTKLERFGNYCFYFMWDPTRQRMNDYKEHLRLLKMFNDRPDDTVWYEQWLLELESVENEFKGMTHFEMSSLALQYYEFIWGDYYRQLCKQAGIEYKGFSIVNGFVVYNGAVV